MTRLLVLLIFLGCCAPAAAIIPLEREAVASPQPAPVTLGTATNATAPLAGHLAVRYGAADADIAAVASGQAGVFTPLSGNFMDGFGPNRTVWLRFRLESTAAQPVQWILRVLPTYLDHVDLYQPSADGWVVTRGGDTAPFAQRVLQDRATAFPLTLPPHETRTFYLRLSHAGAFNVYPTLYTPAAYQRLLTIENLVFGLYFGVAALLLLISLVHWFTLREAIFLAFSAYLALRGLYFLCYDGLAYQWLLPNHPEFLHNALRFLLAWTVASIAPILVHVLNLSPRFPRLTAFVWRLGGLAALISLTVFTGDFPRFGNLLSLIVLIFGLLGGIVAFGQLRENRPLAGLILLTMSLMMLGLVTSALASFRISSGTFWDVYGGQIASFATFLTLHFAITQRVLEIKREKLASEREARLAKILAAQEQAARREQAEFFALLFHEIKTPLAEISSATTVLEQLDDGTHRETGARYDTIHQAVDRLNQMVEQNLARDRLGLAGAHLNRQAIEPAQLAQQVVASFRDGQQHPLRVDAPADLPTVHGDPEFLRIALANLIDNAIKYTPAGCEICLSVQVDANTLLFRVRDHGPGLTADALAHAFERYWRGDNHGSIAGSGLGLHLVRRIAEAHGGSACVESRPGEGSTFTLALPLRAP